MILVIGATGKTGKALVKHLAVKQVEVKLLIRPKDLSDKCYQNKNIQFSLGDLRDLESLKSAFKGVDQIYFICPNLMQDEFAIGQTLIRLAQENHLSRFCYHSVLHPQIEAMPHHWQKMRVEEFLFQSGLPYTILQPCTYMQNIKAYWNEIIHGKLILPYRKETRTSMVDLDDVAEVASTILTNHGYDYSIFELVGQENLSQEEIALQLSEYVRREVIVVEQSVSDWSIKAQLHGMDLYKIESLIKMFHYYENYGFTGNSTALTHLLGRTPTTFTQFLLRSGLSSGSGEYDEQE